MRSKSYGEPGRYGYGMKLVLIPFIAVLAACSQMPTMSCASTDWYSLGERDGLFGTPPRVDSYAYQCSRQNVAIQQSDYMNGWWVGNATYRDRTAGSEGG
jgi:hypothetical protein